jgi:hypothetical protein
MAELLARVDGMVATLDQMSALLLEMAARAPVKVAEPKVADKPKVAKPEG